MLENALRRRRAVIVAHPDDETLWFGGLMLRYPGDWTVVCCSVPRLDPIRAWKLHDACEVLGAKVRLIPFVESGPTEQLDTLDLIVRERWDCVVTHGEEGEYGHLHHRGVHARCMQIFRGQVPVITTGKGEVLGLDAREWERKCEALRRYNHVMHYPPLGDVAKWEALLHRYGERRTEEYTIA